MAAPAWAARFVGIPYAKGKDALTEADCWGLFNLVHREHYGRPLPPYDGPLWFGAETDRAGLGAAARAYSALFAPVDLGAEREGDGILWNCAGYPIHLAMVLEPGLMLHIEEGCDSVVERYPQLVWPVRRIAGVFRYV